jgi:hypothetical protein
MRLALVAIQMLILLTPLAAEDPLSRYIPDGSLEQLRSGKTLFASILPSEYKLSLLPAITSGDSIAAEVREQKPSIGVEMSSIISGLPQQMDTPEGWLLLYNALHAVSTLKGIPYYSVTRKANHVLFTDAYVIDSAETRNRLADPVFTEIPPENLIYTLQDDDAFGKNVYEERFSFKDDHLVVRIDNVTSIRFLFFTLIDAHNLVSEVALIPSGNDLGFYGVSYLNTGFPLGDRGSREESLKNRLWPWKTG